MTASASGVEPGRGVTAYRWARKNLFRTWLDAFLTLIFGGLGLYVLVQFMLFVFVTFNDIQRLFRG